MKTLILIFLLHLLILQFATAQNLQSEIETIALKHDMMGGAVTVFCSDRIIGAHYFGKSDLKRNIKVSEDTKFRVASISKMITAIAVMQLAEKNLLNLDADISTILGYKVRNSKFKKAAITVRMLLSHTSTIIDGDTYNSFLDSTVYGITIPNLSELLTTGGKFYSKSQFVNHLPASYFQYSNTNYVILGTIVEKLSGLRFDAYCKQNIFDPLGLDASYNVSDLKEINDVAVLYRKVNNVWEPQADNYQGTKSLLSNVAGYIPGTNGGRFGAQGGLRCSAKDLVSIFMCLNNSSLCTQPLLNPTNIAAMRANNWLYNGSNGNNYDGLFLSWGLGMQRITSTTGKDVALPGSAAMFGHTGEAYGLLSDAYYDSERKVGFVFITNGVGKGFQTNSKSGFYTVEQEIFKAIEDFGDLQNCK